MHRATPANTSLRAYAGSGSRSCVDQVDDSKLMQEMGGNMMKNESRSKVESPQNYGFTSACMPADKDATGKIIASAEACLSHVGGNRGHSVAGNMDDRRHRLRGLSPGDSAMNRTNADDMQIHLASDGLYHSAPQKVRMQLVPAGSGKANPPQNQAQATQAKRSLYATFEPRIQERLWAGLEPELELELDLKLGERRGLSVEARAGNGSGSSGGGSQGGGQQLKTGQKAVAGAGADSKDFHDLQAKDHRISSSTKVSLASSKEDDDVLHQTRSQKDYCGGTPDKHKFSKVLTLDGPAKNVYGRIG
jgi:phage gp45-like